MVMSFPFLHLHHFHAHPVSGTYFLKLCLYLSGSGRKIFRNSQLHGYFMILEICQKLEEENRQLKQGHFKRKNH